MIKPDCCLKAALTNAFKPFLFLLLGIVLIFGCGRPKSGELFGIVKLEKAVNSEGILLYIPGTEFRALTDADGAFLFAGLPPGEHTLVAHYEGFNELRQSVIVQPGKRTSIGPLLLQKPYIPKGTISGFITLEGQTNHESITVILVGTTYSTTTNTTGFFQFDAVSPGSYQLLAVKDDWISVSKEDIKVVDGEETEISKFQLRRLQQEPTPAPESPSLGEMVLQGSAFLEGETNHAGIRIYLADLPEKYTITDATGYFRLDELDEKHHSLILSHLGYLDETIPNAIPVSATSTSSCGFVTLQKEFQPETFGVLQGRIYLEGQTQHDNITVQLQGINPPVFTDAEGRYKFVGVPAGQYVLIAERPGFETGRMEDIVIGANQVALAPDLTLSASDGADQEGKGGIVGLALLEGEMDQGGVLVAIQGTSLTAVTGSNGQFVFQDVPVGAYTLIYTKAEFKNYYLEGVPVEVDQNTALEPVILAKDVDPPYVVDSYPRDGARKIPIDGFIDVVIRFSERMDARSVKQSVVIEPQVGFELFFDRESELSDLDALHIRMLHEPPMPLQFDERYQIVITPQARTPKGVPMAEPFVFSFTTDGPLIVDSVPRKGEAQFFIDRNRKIMLLTNAPVDQSTFERSMRFRPQPDSKPIIEFMPMGLGTQILIDASLRPNTRYRLQFDNALRTVDRKRFSNTPFSLNFRTEYIPNMDQAQPGRRQPMGRRRR